MTQFLSSSGEKPALHEKLQDVSELPVLHVCFVMPSSRQIESGSSYSLSQLEHSIPAIQDVLQDNEAPTRPCGSPRTSRHTPEKPLLGGIRAERINAPPAS